MLSLQTILITAGDPVFQYLDKGEFDKLDMYLENHDINARFGDSAVSLLVYSILYNKNRVTHYLVDRGADVNQFVDGKSPLMHASGNGQSKKVAILVSNQAAINALDSVNNTSLIYAVRNGDLKTVKYLVRNGASLNHRNKDGDAAYDESVSHYHLEVTKYLRHEYVKNLPDLHDGPYISWKGRRKIKAFYMVHDSVRHLTTKEKGRFKADANPYLMKGFSLDSMNYLVSKQRETPPDQYEAVKDIMVLGDIHGGYDSLHVFLINNGVMDAHLNWSWGKGHLVFLGDIFDRGDKVTEALWLIYQLEGQAAEAGGAVHLILGNHEIMVLNNIHSYVGDKYMLMTEKLNLTYGGLFNKHSILGQWLRTRHTILKINDHLFVHAGLSPEIFESELSMHDINKQVRFFLNHPNREFHGEINKQNIMGVNGPFWYRGYLEDNQVYKHLPDQELDKILGAFHADRIFIGHTNVDQVTPLYSNRVYAMDVPFYSTEHDMQGISIENGIFYLLNSTGNKTGFR